MKHFTSSQLGIWNEITSNNTNSTKIKMTKNEINSLSEQIEETLKSNLKNCLVDVTEEESAMCNYIYNKNKPEINENDKYQFISCDLTVNNTKINGIINYRLNNLHKQARF